MCLICGELTAGDLFGYKFQLDAVERHNKQQIEWSKDTGRTPEFNSVSAPKNSSFFASFRYWVFVKVKTDH